MKFEFTGPTDSPFTFGLLWAPHTKVEGILELMFCETTSPLQMVRSLMVVTTGSGSTTICPIGPTVVHAFNGVLTVPWNKICWALVLELFRYIPGIESLPVRFGIPEIESGGLIICQVISAPFVGELMAMVSLKSPEHKSWFGRL